MFWGGWLAIGVNSHEVGHFETTLIHAAGRDDQFDRVTINDDAIVAARSNGPSSHVKQSSGFTEIVDFVLETDQLTGKFHDATSIYGKFVRHWFLDRTTAKSGERRIIAKSYTMVQRSGVLDNRW